MLRVFTGGKKISLSLPIIGEGTKKLLEEKTGKIKKLKILGGIWDSVYRGNKMLPDDGRVRCWEGTKISHKQTTWLREKKKCKKKNWVTGKIHQSEKKVYRDRYQISNVVNVWQKFKKVAFLGGDRKEFCLRSLKKAKKGCYPYIHERWFPHTKKSRWNDWRRTLKGKTFGGRITERPREKLWL